MRWRWRGALEGLFVSVPSVGLQLGFGWPAFAAGDPHAFAIMGTVVAVFVATEAASDPVSTHLTKGEDQKGAALIRLGYLLGTALGAYDLGRHHLGPAMPEWVRWLGLGVFGAGWLVRVACFAVNDYFANVVVVQKERNHVVVDRGPYRVVRHPAYAGLAASLPALALAFGAWTALPPLLFSAAFVIRRTELEDRYLLRELAGYGEYARRVRYRLLPGIY